MLGGRYRVRGVDAHVKKLQRVIHVRVVDTNGLTVEVRVYSQSSGTGAHCVGTMRVSRIWWRELLYPVLRAGALYTGICVVFDIRPRGETREQAGTIVPVEGEPLL